MGCHQRQALLVLAGVLLHGCVPPETSPLGASQGSGGAAGAGGQLTGGSGGGPPEDADRDGYPSDVDCDDGDDQVHPGATELCDGIDNDCDGDVDGPNAEGVTTWYRDQDGDGWGIEAEIAMACEQQPGWAPQPGDCHDGEESIYPGAPELCDLLDNDCDGFGDVAPEPVVDPPWGTYYDSADPSSDTALRLSLHEIIDDHLYFPYSSQGAIDTRDILELADEDPADAQRILDVYRNASYPKGDSAALEYNREHVWPQSLLPDGADRYPHTDCHHLFLCDAGYNSSRSNLPFDSCGPGCSERPTEYNNGRGGGTGQYPGNSNWRQSDGWEAWVGRRGDVARALLYMDVRYEGGTHGVTAHAEPDLVLTDDRDLIVTSEPSDTVAYMGMLSTLLRWHCADPPSPDEVHHHDVVYSHQGNRNPFVDHPEWAYCVFLGQCGP